MLTIIITTFGGRHSYKCSDKRDDDCCCSLPRYLLLFQLLSFHPVSSYPFSLSSSYLVTPLLVTLSAVIILLFTQLPLYPVIPELSCYHVTCYSVNQILGRLFFCYLVTSYHVSCYSVTRLLVNLVPCYLESVPLVVAYKPELPKLHKTVIKQLQILHTSPKSQAVFKEPLLPAYRKGHDLLQMLKHKRLSSPYDSRAISSTDHIFVTTKIYFSLVRKVLR